MMYLNWGDFNQDFNISHNLFSYEFLSDNIRDIRE